jgi:HSP20 family molecular chaperone IbpA
MLGFSRKQAKLLNGQPANGQSELHHHRHHQNIQKQQPQEYVSKIERPADVDLKHVKAYLSTDSVLTLEAQLPPRTHSPVANTDHLPKGSPSHGPQQALHDSRSNSPASRSRSGSTCGSPAKGAQTGTPVKIGAPTFFERDGVRQLSLTVDLGGPFKASEVAVHVVKENRLLVKARHEECTTERMVKSKFCREYELAEKIEPFSTRAGLAEDRHILVIGALTKMHIAACLVAASTGGSGTCSGSSNCTPVASKKRVPPPPLPLSIAKSPKSSLGNLQEISAKEMEEGHESQAPPPADVIQLPTNVIPCIVINLAAFPPKEVSD